MKNYIHQKFYIYIYTHTHTIFVHHAVSMPKPFLKVASWYLSLLKHTTVKLRQKLETKCRLTCPSPLLTVKHSPTSTFSELTFDFPPLSALLHLFCFLWSSLECCCRYNTRKKERTKGTIAMKWTEKLTQKKSKWAHSQFYAWHSDKAKVNYASA